MTCRLADWLSDTLSRIAPSPDGARILRDHLHWIEYHLRQVLRDCEGPTPAGPLLAAAGEALQAHLQLAEADAKRLATDLERLGQEVGHGEIMGYGRYPSVHLLVHAVRSRVLPRRQAFMARIEESIRGLKSLLAVEWGKSDESIEPRQARDSVGPGGDRFDPLALSTVMDYSRGTHAMGPERRARIERALEVLQGWRPDPVLVRFVHLGSLGGDWLTGRADLEDITRHRSLRPRHGPVRRPGRQAGGGLQRRAHRPPGDRRASTTRPCTIPGSRTWTGRASPRKSCCWSLW